MRRITLPIFFRPVFCVDAFFRQARQKGRKADMISGVSPPHCPMNVDRGEHLFPVTEVQWESNQNPAGMIGHSRELGAVAL